MCKVIDLRDNSEQTILVYDPNGRIEQTHCEVDPTLSLPAHLYSEIPEIIISELLDEATHYDWQNEIGEFHFDVYGNKYKFFVDKNVRHPGQWSLVTFQMIKKCVEVVFSNVESQSQQLKIWDMGCGCGIVGILTGAVLHNKVNRLLFSDIEAQAIKCTERNLSQLLPSMPSCTVREGNLFAACDTKEKFHVIAFNPPFLPLLQSKDTSFDSGGNKGYEIAEEYCANLYEYLDVGGWGILAIADYVDDGRVKSILSARFGEENIQVQERLILYPYEPTRPIPPAYEITARKSIERICDYHFENIYLGGKRFLMFKMRHYLANRKH